MKKIAIVEDTPSIAEMLSYALQNLGYEVLPFANGKDFIASIGSLKFDLLILDLMLPGISGEDILREMDNRGLTAGLRLLIYSAINNPESVMDHFPQVRFRALRKPSRLDELLLAVKTLLAD
ncbi:MAG: response regulator [Candidatus Wallbacteria bacterium]|nr:response regulator [Candidatus Wallbacteria bacterium]